MAAGAVALEDAGEVELGAGGGGDGDAVVDGDLVGGENGSVKEEAGLGRLVHRVVTSIRPFHGRIAQSAPADRWLSTPPVARVAAIHRPRCETTWWPTAYTRKRVEPPGLDPTVDRTPPMSAAINCARATTPCCPAASVPITASGPKSLTSPLYGGQLSDLGSRPRS